MDYYFLSNLPYHLKVDGKYAGKVGKNLKVLKCCNLNFLEFLPISVDYLPCYSDLKSLENIKKFPLLGGEIILPIFDKKPNFHFKFLGQKHFSVKGQNYLLSVAIDGAVKFYVDGNQSIIENLPFIPDSFDLFNVNNLVFFTFTSKKTMVIGYDFSRPSISLVFKDIVDSFEVDSTLKTQKRYNFINPIEVFEEWDFSSPLTLQSRRTKLLKRVSEIHEKLIPLSFMETVSVMGDLSIYLTSKLNERAKDIYEFIKKPIYLFNPPNVYNEVISITEKEIFTYKFEIEHKSICNLIEK